MSVEVSCQGI